MATRQPYGWYCGGLALVGVAVWAIAPAKPRPRPIEERLHRTALSGLSSENTSARPESVHVELVPSMLSRSATVPAMPVATTDETMPSDQIEIAAAVSEDAPRLTAPTFATSPETAPVEPQPVAIAEEPNALPVSRLESPLFPKAELSTEIDYVRELHPNGALKSERTVVRNEAGDWVSHGPWRSFDDRGAIVGSGRYAQGRRAGHWTRVLKLEELPPNTLAIAEGFTGPFTSEAGYEDDRPHGLWRLSDANCAIVFEVHLSEGLRNGRTVYYRPTGVKRSDAQYVAGQLHGTLVKLALDAKTADEKHLLWGRAPERIERRDDQGRIQIEESWLGREIAILDGDDPWQGRLATFGERSERVRHGTWTGYDDEGHVAWQCQYVLGQLHGPAIWRYPDGQLKIEGHYALGRPTGRWKWRHANGMPAAAGDYTEGEPTGAWLAWNDDGRQVGRRDLNAAEALTKRPETTRDARLETPQLPDGVTQLK